MPVYALSFYANYACRHSGACCTAGWSIPVEPRLLPILRADLIVPDAKGQCLRYDTESRLCTIHRDRGEETLPGSCYQFPRRALIDDRGTFVALSNFCPTAATLLYESDASLAIVSAPPAFPGRRVYEGLDARGQWPPLVRRGLLFDLESYSRWEAFMVSAFAHDAATDDALARIAAAAETLRTWTPGCGSFDAWATKTLQPTASADSAALRIYERFRTLDAYEALRRFVPDGLTAPEPLSNASANVSAACDSEARAARRYLASKAFASWCAYESRGIRTLVAELMVSELVLRVERERASRAAKPLDRSPIVEAIRQSDRLLMHLIDRPRMIEWLGQVETFTTKDTMDTKVDDPT